MLHVLKKLIGGRFGVVPHCCTSVSTTSMMSILDIKVQQTVVDVRTFVARQEFARLSVKNSTATP